MSSLNLVPLLSKIMGETIELLAAIILTIAAIKTMIGSFNVKNKNDSNSKHESLRISLAKSISLALELLLGADVLMTAVTPTWNDLAQLASIVVLRTALNFTLSKELKTEHPTPKQQV